MNDITARIVIMCMIFVPIGYDLLAILLGWPTISSTMRTLDVQTGSLFRWLTLLGWLAVWMHCFLPKPWGGWDR